MSRSLTATRNTSFGTWGPTSVVGGERLIQSREATIIADSRDRERRWLRHGGASGPWGGPPPPPAPSLPPSYLPGGPRGVCPPPPPPLALHRHLCPGPPPPRP